MKVIFCRDSRNVKGKLKVPNAPHPEHIAKGTILEIGTGATLKEIERASEREAQHLAMLFVSGAVTEWTPEVEARVRAEIETERVRLERAAELDRNAAFAALGAQLAELGSQVLRATPDTAR